MAVIKITDAFMRRPNEPGLYWDKGLTGLGVRISKRKRAFVFQKAGGKRTTIGEWRDGMGMSVRQARDTANALITERMDPNNEISQITLTEAIDAKIRRLRLDNKSERTAQDYRNILDHHATDWLERPLVELTRSEIAKRHEYIGTNSGIYRANAFVRILRAIYNHAATTNEGLGEWPGKGIKLFTEERRNEPIQDLRAWRTTLDTLQNSLTRDWWLLVLYTGLRKSDALTIRWENISEDGWLHIPTPKGGSSRAFDLPLSRQAREILARNQQVCDWVFWNTKPNGDFTHLQSARTAITRRLPSPHRLRDTWATNAAEAGCPFPIIKKLLNHKVSKQDITLGYINPGRDAMQLWAQNVADYIDSNMDLASQDDVAL